MDSVFCGMLRPSSKIEGSQKMPNNRRGRNSLAARNHFYKKSRLHDFGTQQIRFQWTQRSDPKRVFLAPNHCRIPTSWSKTWVSPLVSAWEALIGWPYTVTCSEAEIVRTYFRFCGNRRSGMCWNFMAKEWPMVMESAESSALLSYAWSKAGLDAVKLGDIKKKIKKTAIKQQTNSDPSLPLCSGRYLPTQLAQSRHFAEGIELQRQVRILGHQQSICDMKNDWDLQKGTFIQITGLF